MLDGMLSRGTQRAVYRPSTGKIAPVMYCGSDDARETTASATSSEWAGVAVDFGIAQVRPVVVGHLGERAADLQAVVEDDDVDGAEGLGGLVGQALGERLVTQVCRDVQFTRLDTVGVAPCGR
jgi:hypothetical protein